MIPRQAISEPPNQRSTPVVSWPLFGMVLHFADVRVLAAGQIYVWFLSVLTVLLSRARMLTLARIFAAEMEMPAEATAKVPMQNSIYLMFNSTDMHVVDDHVEYTP